MTTESKPLATEPQSSRVQRKGPNWGRVIALMAWLGFLGLFAAVGRTDVDPRVANPNVEGRPRPVAFLTAFDEWQIIPQVGAVIIVVVFTVAFIRGWRKNPGSPTRSGMCSRMCQRTNSASPDSLMPFQIARRPLPRSATSRLRQP